ncbi:MAG: 30S ribosomal protein S5 [Planctomycetes bacterium]|nr:30S ribosomal protein S5 [Planctomycetota bacterium]
MVAERIESAGLNLEERIVDIWRCAKVVKGGRRFSFAAMAVVGNGHGVAGMGYGKGREVPIAIEKAVKDAKKHLVRIPTYGSTIGHEVRGKYATAAVVMIPALPGTGVIAGQAVRAVLESIGIRDVLTKSVGGNNNAKNLVKAAFEALELLRKREDVAALRGVVIADDPVLVQSLRMHQSEPARQQTPRFQDDRPRGPRGKRRERDAGASSASQPAAAAAAAAPATPAAEASAGAAEPKKP